MEVGNNAELGLGLGLGIGLGVMCLMGMFLHTQLRDLCMLINTLPPYYSLKKKLLDSVETPQMEDGFDNVIFCL